MISKPGPDGVGDPREWGNHPDLQGATVCLPRLGLVPLCLVRLALGKHISIYYDDWPLYAKALNRWLRVPEATLTRLFSICAGVRVARVAQPDVQRGSPRTNLRAMKQVTIILESLRSKIQESGWLAVLSDLLGATPALAYYHRSFPCQQIWPAVIAGVICKDLVKPEQRIILVLGADWPECWRNIVERDLACFGLSIFPWPAWYAKITALLTNMYWLGRVIFSTVSASVSHGWPRRMHLRQRVAAVIEFIEYSRLHGRPVDTNYFEDGLRLKRSDIIYFVTRAQEKFLARNGQNVGEMLARAEADGFRIVRQKKLRYSWATLRFAARVSAHLVRRSPHLGPACLAATFWCGWTDFLSHVPLFDSYQPRNYLHTMAPNGSTGLRLDSAIVTGLCRRFGSRSVGYQNRCIYDSVYEDCFDCYDIYLAWGERWRDVLGRGNEFVEKTICVGCQNNDGIVPHAPDASTERRIVSIFSSDFGSTLYPKSTTINLLTTCIRLARRYPDWRFQVKMKDSEMVDLLLADEEFRKLCAEVQTNFSFLRLARHDCADTICESDIIIGAAWTTPASDALILGKRIIYYDEFDAGGLAFSRLPHMIARSSEELELLFDFATKDYQDYAIRHKSLLDDLDPFRDGKARDRILDVLLDQQPAEEFNDVGELADAAAGHFKLNRSYT